MTVRIYISISIILCISTMLKSMQQLSFISPIHQTNTCSLVSNYSIYAAQLKALSHFGTPQSQSMLAKLRMRTTLPLSLLKYRAARYYTGNNQDNVRQLTLLLQQTNQRVQLHQKDFQLLLEQSQLLKDISGDLGDSGDQEIPVDMLSNEHQVALFLDCLALMPATKESDIAPELLKYLQAQSILDLSAILTAAEFFSIGNTEEDNTNSFCTLVSRALAYKLIDTQECTAHQELVLNLPIEIQRMLVQHILDSTGLRSSLHIKYNSRHPITVIPLENSKDNIGDLDSESLSISPNKRYIAVHCRDSDIRVWDSKTGKCLYTLSDFNHECKPKRAVIQWSPNSKYFAAQAFDEKSIKIWDSQSGQCLQELSTDKQWPLKWSLDSKYLAYAADDTTIKIWDSETNQVVHELLNEQKVNQIDWFLKSKYVVYRSGSFPNTTISIWDSENGQQLHELPTVRDREWCSPNSRFLAFISSNKTVKIWDSIFNEFTELFEDNDSSIDYAQCKWSPNNKYLLIEFKNGIYIWNIANKRIINKLFIQKFEFDRDYSSQWSSDSRYIALSFLHDRSSGKITVLDNNNGDCHAVPIKRRGLTYYNSIFWSPNSKYLACIAEDYDDHKNVIGIWNSENGQCFSIPKKYEVWGINWSPDSRYLIIVSKNAIRVWDIKHNTCVITHQSKNQNIIWLLSKTNKCIFVTDNNCLLIWHWINKKFDKELANKLTLKSLLIALHTNNKNKQDVEQLVKSLWPMLNSNTSKLDNLKQSKSVQAALTSVGIYTGFKVLKYALQKAHYQS